MSKILDGATVTKPAGGWSTSAPILVSPVKAKGGSSSGVRMHVVFEAIEKDPAPAGNPGFLVKAVIEEELAPNVFVPVAAQFQEINNNERKNQILVLTPNPVFDQGTPEVITGDTVVSRTQNELPGDYRLAIYYRVVDPAKADLASMTVTAYAQET